MPKIFCHKCNCIHEKGEHVGGTNNPPIDIPTDNPRKKRKRLCEMKEQDRIIQEFYCSKKWKLKREERIKKCKGLCEVCLACGIVKLGRELHHIVKLRKDFSKKLDDDNLIFVCSECHRIIEDCCESIEDIKKYIEEKKKERNK